MTLLLSNEKRAPVDTVDGEAPDPRSLATIIRATAPRSLVLADGVDGDCKDLFAAELAGPVRVNATNADGFSVLQFDAPGQYARIIFVSGKWVVAFSTAVKT